ncbi:hypothetical protein SDC9_98448 [bioreactor metagenome]|uniref:Uncharacterized protein n=1 Tax=bioreactor metagenome TaxID=1076179 RepID=A0A645AFA6_9ZZZZ
MSDPITIDADTGAEAHDATPHCPRCGSRHVAVLRKTYNPGCGCLGLLLFGWWGLLLGLLGFDDVEMICTKCGARWPAGRPEQIQTGCGGCLTLLLAVLVLLVFLGSCNCFAIF